jgi:hypothetical protein
MGCREIGNLSDSARDPLEDRERPAAWIVQQFTGVKRLTRWIVTVAILVLFGPHPADAATPDIYRIELAGNIVLYARTPPVPRGSRIVFARYPDGAIMSLKASDVRRVVVTPVVKANTPNMKPGELLVLGPTGEGGSRTAPAPAGGARAPEGPGEGPDGKALLNPTRDYRPSWDARQVPGMNLPYPASPGDYREGATLSYPPGNANQSGPGQPPTGVPSGEPPKSPR